MSHELEIKEDGTASMFSGEGITPWHGLGVVVEGLATASEALELAGLDWTVSKQPMYFGEGSEKIAYPGQYVNVRDTDNKPLGTSTDGYHVFQNVEAFDFLDQITDTGSGEAKYTTAGSLFGGKRVFMTMKIGDTFTVADNDAHDMYLMVTNSHDATQALTVAVTTIRAVCNNTVTMALKDAKTKWTLRHKTSLKGKVQDARDSLEIAFKYADAFQDEVAALMEVEMTKDKFKKIVDTIVPASKFQHDKDVSSIMDVWENEKTVPMGGGENNGWGAFNAVTFFTDHVKKYQTEESRFNSLIDLGGQRGFADTLRNDAKKLILATA